MPIDLDERSIRAALTGRFGAPLRFFDEVGSTNTIAMRWAEEGAPEGALVATDHQTAGRGRRGRAWFSEPGTALQFSLVLRPGTSVDATGLLTAAVGIACADGIEAETGARASIKWPNDVVMMDKKVAGILVESKVVDQTLELAIVGVGINVSWPSQVPDDIAARATSLDRVIDAPAPVDRTRLLSAILSALERVYSLVKHPGGRADLVRRIEARSANIGKDVVVRFPDGTTVQGTAFGITPAGGLRLATGDMVHEIHAGEIERVRETGRD